MKALGAAAVIIAIFVGTGEAVPRVPMGTFSNLEYHQESGDLAGIEIKIVPTSRGHQGALLIAEGMPQEFIVVPVVIDENRIRFVVPASYDTYGGTEFDGTFDGNAIRGRIRYPSGVIEQIRLLRRGHWDSPAAVKRSPAAPKPDTRPQPSK